MIVRISAPYFTAAYDMDSGNIAPIIKYMKGWSYEKILNYCNKKGWKLEYHE